jgi:hypothetical protein
VRRICLIDGRDEIYCSQVLTFFESTFQEQGDKTSTYREPRCIYRNLDKGTDKQDISMSLVVSLVINYLMYEVKCTNVARYHFLQLDLTKK